MKTELIIFAFIAGFIFCSTYKHSYEGMENKVGQVKYKSQPDQINKKCHNLLLREGNTLHLINTRAPRVKGINPIVFDNLEEYIDYWEFQKEQGIDCPVLYFQETYDTQNKKGYRLLVNPMEPNAGISSVFKQKKPEKIKRLLSDANRDDPPYNQNQFAGFDPEDQNVGVETPLDNKTHLDNPMDPKWAGHKYTHQSIKSGKFDGRTRKPKEPTILGSGY